MISTTLTDFRKEMKSYLDKITDEHETVIINRGKDKGVVLISIENYTNYMNQKKKGVSLSLAELERLDKGILAADNQEFASENEVNEVLNRYANEINQNSHRSYTDLSEAEKASIKQGIDDANAGKVTPHKEVIKKVFG
jgi:antitoxin YefM